MGLSLKSIGKGLKKVARVAAPIVGMINPVAGIALGAASGLGEGKKSLKSMAIGGALGGIGAAGKALGGSGALKSVGGALRGVGGFAAKNPELILGAAQAYQGSRQAAKADAMNKRALALAEQPWNETSDLRRMAIEQLGMRAPRPDLGGVYGGGSNPFGGQSGFGRFGR